MWWAFTRTTAGRLSRSVLQGTLTEHRENGEVLERHQGESWTEGKDVTHWAENKGDGTAVVIAVDVFKP